MSATGVKTYGWVFAALLFLMVATVAASFVHTGRFHLMIALAIAAAKAVLILVYFMHLKASSRWIWLFFAASLYMLVAGGILTFADYLYRT
jgi:cytochrome c oxidase subunit IV